MFLGWVNEKAEHKTAFEACSLMQTGRSNLQGRWKIIRKIRLVRFVRKLIEEGVIVRGVREIYEEGVRILSEMEKRKVKEEEEEYMFELYMLKVRGMEKKMKEDEVTVLRRQVEEERKGREEEKMKREESEKKLKEANSKAEEEKKKREDEERRGAAEKRKLEAIIERMRAEMEEMKKGEEEGRRRKEEEAKKYIPITSLDGTSVTFPESDGIKREGNAIIHHGSTSNRNCFIGGVMTSV